MDRPTDLGRLLGCCGHLSMLYAEKGLRRRGLDVTPVQTRVLLFLSDRSGQNVNPRELERELRLKPPTVNGIVSRLEEKGYLLRRSSPSDGRCRLLSLTEAGRRLVEAFAAAMEDSERFTFSVLSEEERRTLKELLLRITENLENEVNKL